MKNSDTAVTPRDATMLQSNIWCSVGMKRFVRICSGKITVSEAASFVNTEKYFGQKNFQGRISTRN